MHAIIKAPFEFKALDANLNNWTYKPFKEGSTFILVKEQSLLVSHANLVTQKALTGAKLPETMLNNILIQHALDAATVVYRAEKKSMQTLAIILENMRKYFLAEREIPGVILHSKTGDFWLSFEDLNLLLLKNGYK